MPKKTTKVRRRNLTLSVPLTLYREIERRARKNEQSRSQWVTQLIQAWVDHR